MCTFNSNFYNILYVVREVHTLFFSAVTFEWIELQRWFTS